MSPGIVPPASTRPPEAATNNNAMAPGASQPRPQPAAGQPVVDSWDERTYVCRAGDTFASISKLQYNSDAYADALLLYNRNHPRAGDALRRDGTIAPGDRIYVPPSAILEKRHGDAVAGAKPKPVGVKNGDDQFGVAPAVYHSDPSGAANPSYKVQGKSEYLIGIAQQVLNDGMRWKELAQLNPDVKPEIPVPPGTVLRLPADAHVPPPGP
jgi:hypothetical protein